MPRNADCILEETGFVHQDHVSTVRRVAAEFLIRELDGLGDDALQFARHFAVDESYAVSERGMFALGKLEEAQM